MSNKWFACLALALGACPSADIDEGEVIPPTVEFDPGNKVIPFPNNLLLSPTTGLVTIPQGCNESAATTATRSLVLNQLDGFGTYQPAINVTFTQAPDPASLTGRVLLFKRETGGGLAPIPLIAIPGQTTRFLDQNDLAACADPVTVEQVTFVPLVPLEQKTLYTVAILSGVTTASGAEFQPSFTWELVRQPEPVVVFDDAGNITTNRTPLDPRKADDLASLQGIDLLWKFHQAAFAFLEEQGNSRDTILLAWEFKTQTTTGPLDPTVAGSPASAPTALPLLGMQSLSAAAGNVGARPAPFNQCAVDDPIGQADCFLRVSIGGADGYATGKAKCAQLGCAAIGNVLGGLMLSKQYMTDKDNTTYTGTGALPVPGQWSDPLEPMIVHDTTNANPVANDVQAKITVIAMLPCVGGAPDCDGTPPGTGFPIVVFQHGLGQSALQGAFAIGGSLAVAGFATVAIDAVNHDSRAVRISDVADADPAKSCADAAGSRRADGGPSPVSHGFCYAPLFSSDLGATRDSFRQSVLDQQQLVTSLTACGTTACLPLTVNTARINYMGQSLGGIYGSMTTGLATGIKASVLNVPGAGWVDIIENTQTLEFQCPLVDALIDAGVLVGDKFDEVAVTGLCTGPEWLTQPGWRQFSVIGRWILDSADPANFNTKLAPRKFLIQRVDGDKVVPNIATDREGALVGRTVADAKCAAPTGAGPTFTASTAISTNPTTSKFVNYPTIPTGTAGCVGGNTYSHGSLLVPPASQSGGPCQANGTDCDAAFGTGQMRTDAITFLLQNQN